MSGGFGVYVLVFLAVVSVIDGCDRTSTRAPEAPHRRGREIKAPTSFEENGEGVFGAAIYKDTSMVYKAEKIFRLLDANNDGVIEASEWVDNSKSATSIWDFVELLESADSDSDEAVSMEELLSMTATSQSQMPEEFGFNLSSLMDNVFHEDLNET